MSAQAMKTAVAKASTCGKQLTLSLDKTEFTFRAKWLYTACRTGRYALTEAQYLRRGESAVESVEVRGDTMHVSWRHDAELKSEFPLSMLATLAPFVAASPTPGDSMSMKTGQDPLLWRGNDQAIPVVDYNRLINDDEKHGARSEIYDSVLKPDSPGFIRVENFEEHIAGAEPPTAKPTRLRIRAMAPTTALINFALCATLTLAAPDLTSECSLPCGDHGTCVLAGGSTQLLSGGGADKNGTQSCRCDSGWQGQDCSEEVPAFLRVFTSQDHLVFLAIALVSDFTSGAIFIGGSLIMTAFISFYINAGLASAASVASGGIFSPTSIPLLSYLVYMPVYFVHAGLFWRECLVQWRPSLMWMIGSLPGMYMGLMISSSLDEYSFRFLVGKFPLARVAGPGRVQ